ncbi:MAG: twin-arginine translocase subunit TatC [Candidatus Poseidoniia archaeon]|nr:twin-arginine translocase subunit TatC [Candidatus Poseidoniia archaeon]
MSETRDISSPLSSHLEELRSHLIQPFMSTIFLILLLLPFSKSIVDNLLTIGNIEITNLTAYSPTEFLRLKLYLSLIGSLLISYPLWLRGIYNFSSPALTIKEKRGFQVCFSIGFILFILGSILGLYYLAPIIFEVLLMNDNVTIAKLSIYETIKLLISISLFSGVLLSLPLLTIFLTEYSSSKAQLRKYLYILIIAIIILGTPEPSMIINLIFLVLFALIIEITLVFGGKNED